MSANDPIADILDTNLPHRPPCKAVNVGTGAFGQDIQDHTNPGQFGKLAMDQRKRPPSHQQSSSPLYKNPVSGAAPPKLRLGDAAFDRKCRSVE